MLTRSGLSRRKLIESTASSILLLPLMRVLKESEALAATSNPRVIFIYFGGGTTLNSFWPTGGSGALGNLPHVSSALNDHKADMIMFKGLCTRGGTDHPGGMYQALAGWGNGEQASSGTAVDMEKAPNSVDQIIADKWSGTTAKRSVILGVQTQWSGNPFTKTISFRNGQQVTPQDNPKAAYSDVFGNFTVPTGGTTVQKTAETNVALGKKRIVDYLLRDVKRIDSALGPYEREAFQSHVTALDDLSKEVDGAAKNAMTPASTSPTSVATTGSTCNFKGLESQFPNLNGEWYYQDANTPKVFELHRKIMVQAMACNATRVSVWQMGNSHQESEFNSEGTNEHGKVIHLRAHDMDIQYENLQFGLMNQVARLAKELKESKIGDHSIFDETLIYCCTDLGDIPGNHSGENVATFTLGNPLGKLKTNRLISFPYEQYVYNNVNGMHYSRALVTAAHAVGVTDVNSIGYIPGKGPIPEYFGS